VNVAGLRQEWQDPADDLGGQAGVEQAADLADPVQVTGVVGPVAGVRFAVFDAVTAVAPSYLVMFAARLFLGVLGGTLWSLLAGSAARLVPAERRGRAIAIVLGGITAALCLGIPAGAALAGAVGWRGSFAVLAALALVLAVMVRLCLPPLDPGQSGGPRPPVRQVAAMPGVAAVLVVTLLLLTGHQVMYTYIAPFLRYAGFGRTGLVLLVFGVVTVAGICVAGALADRRPQWALACTLAVFCLAMGALGLAGHVPAVLLIAVAVWGAAYGAAPTLLQTALISASGADSADVATSLQTTIYNAGIAAGSLAGGLILGGLGARALPWAAGLVIAAALTATRRTQIT
jgi:predicted MFS family arabinose efflux permease